MRLDLRVYFLSNLDQHDLVTFFQVRKSMLARVADEFRRLEPHIDDAALVFRGLGPGERNLIETFCRELSPQFDFVVSAAFAPAEILRARFVQFLIDRDYLDRHESINFNQYPKRLCDACCSVDLSEVPDPFIIERPKYKNHLYMASNGVRIISRHLWDQLERWIGPWVRNGRVAYADAPSHVVNDWLWITPNETIGRYVRSTISRTCSVCNRPVEIRMCEPRDPILKSMDVVTEIPPTEAPIALVGLWHGELSQGSSPRLAWDVAISGALHSRLSSLQIKGFVTAGRPIQTWAEVRGMLSFGPNPCAY